MDATARSNPRMVARRTSEGFSRRFLLLVFPPIAVKVRNQGHIAGAVPQFAKAGMRAAGGMKGRHARGTPFAVSTGIEGLPPG
jgi:hypothetical protein